MFTTQQLVLGAIVMVFIALGVFYFGRTSHSDWAARCPNCGGARSKNTGKCPRCG